MRELIPVPDPRRSLPTIPPCDFDSALRHAIASPDSATPSLERQPNSTSSYSRIQRRRFAHIANLLAHVRYRMLDAIGFLTRFYVRLCILIVTVGLIIYLGTAISLLTRAEPLPPFPSPSCPTSSPPANTSLAVARGFKF